MEWAAVAGLIIQYGLPFAEFVINKVKQGGTVTTEEWAQAKVLANVSAKSELLERLKANGIDPSSPQGVAMLALVP